MKQFNIIHHYVFINYVWLISCFMSVGKLMILWDFFCLKNFRDQCSEHDYNPPSQDIIICRKSFKHQAITQVRLEVEKDELERGLVPHQISARTGWKTNTNHSKATSLHITHINKTTGTFWRNTIGSLFELRVYRYIFPIICQSFS